MDNKLSYIKERILHYVDNKKIAKEAFFDSIGMTYGSFKGANKYRPLNSDAVENILTVYSDINSDWLMTGKGDMLKNDKRNDKRDDKLTAQNEEKAAVYKQQIEQGKVAESTTLYGKDSRLNDTKEETRPRIPMNAAAGTLSMLAQDGVTKNDCEQIPVIKAFARYDFTIFAQGDSMEPEYHSGDELACLYIRDASYIQWGRCFVLDTSQGVILKRIFDDGVYFICKSDNPSYKDFSVPKTDVYNIAIVVGLVRRY